MSCGVYRGFEKGFRENIYGEFMVLGVDMAHMSRDQNPLVGNPSASGGKELAVSKRVGFVS